MSEQALPVTEDTAMGGERSFLVAAILGCDVDLGRALAKATEIMDRHGGMQATPATSAEMIAEMIEWTLTQP